MPWTPQEFNQRHLRGRASPEQARVAASAANSALEYCRKRRGKDCEGYAVRTGRAAAANVGSKSEWDSAIEATEREITEYFRART
jgi:hypothetical protein